MNKKILSLLFASTLVLGACGGEDTDSEGDEEAADDVEDVVEDTDNEADEVEDDSELYEYNEELVDSENLKATIISVEKIYDEDWDEEKIVVKFEIENKRDDIIEVQARTVSMNDRMVDESFLMMSQEVDSGKIADATLEIENYDGEVPDLEDNLEMILHIFSWDDSDYVEDVDVSVTFE